MCQQYVPVLVAGPPDYPYEGLFSQPCPDKKFQFGADFVRILKWPQFFCPFVRTDEVASGLEISPNLQG
jgi:hypothetical protein